MDDSGCGATVVAGLIEVGVIGETTAAAGAAGVGATSVIQLDDSQKAGTSRASRASRPGRRRLLLFACMARSGIRILGSRPPARGPAARISCGARVWHRAAGGASPAG